MLGSCLVWALLQSASHTTAACSQVTHAACAALLACWPAGNDIDMLEGHHLSIVVGNAHPVLMDWAAQRQQRGGGELLVAGAHRAWGILEGLHKFGFKA